MDTRQYEIFMNILNADKSEVFKEWHRLSGITKEEFADALKWICEDYRNYAGLTPTGWVKVHRYTERCGEVFRTMDGRYWGGASFERDLDEEEQRFWGTKRGTFFRRIKIAAFDKI